MAKQADLTKTLINNQHVTDMSLQYYFVCEFWEAVLSHDMCSCSCYIKWLRYNSVSVYCMSVS